MNKYKGKDPKGKRIGIKPGDEITFKYLFLDDYHPEYVSGAFGGITPRKDIVLNFFFERSGLPNKQTFKVQADGTIGKMAEKVEPGDLEASFVRQVKSGVILSREVAIEMRDFLNEMLGVFDKVEVQDDLP